MSEEGTSFVKTKEEYAAMSDEDLLQAYVIAGLRSARYANRGYEEASTKYGYIETYTQGLLYERGYTEESLSQDKQNMLDIIGDVDMIEFMGEDVDIRFLAEGAGTREDLIEKYMSLSAYEREITPRFKSQLEGPTQLYAYGTFQRWDEGSVTLNEGMATQCVLTANEDGTKHCSGYLGDFDYDPEKWAIGYKDVENEDGSTSRLPVLKFIGKAPGNIGQLKALNYNVPDFDTQGSIGMMRNATVTIPEGVRILDYTFEDCDSLIMIPAFPESVESIHCAFKNCENLTADSRQLAVEHITVSGFEHWGWPKNMLDMSNAFANCEHLGNLSMGNFPSTVLTIDGMFDGCPQVCSKRTSFESYIRSEFFKGLGLSTMLNNANWSDVCPNLMPIFSDAADSTTGNGFKKINDRENDELKEFQRTHDWDSEPEAVQEAHLDAVAASATKETEQIIAQEDVVYDPDKYHIDMPETNRFGEIINTLMVDGSIGLAAGGAASLIFKPDSGLKKAAVWGGAIGGTLLLDSMGVLPRSFEPVFQWVSDQLPEGVFKSGLDRFISVIHIPTEEEIQAAKDKQYEYFKGHAFQNVFERAGQSAGVVSDESLRKFMSENGKNLAQQGVFASVGEKGINDAQQVYDIMHNLMVGTENNVFEQRIAAGEDASDAMRRYYTGLMTALEGYNEGAVTGSSGFTGEGAETARLGLQYTNCAYASAVMDSLLKYNDQYHFMTEEDWQKFDAMHIDGVGKLSEYTQGSLATPVDNPAFDSYLERRVSAHAPQKPSVSRGTAAEERFDYLHKNRDEEMFQLE